MITTEKMIMISNLTQKTDQYRLLFILDEGATAPVKANEGDLGFDLFTNDLTTLAPGEVKLVNTGLRCSFPTGYGALIKDRSSVSSKRRLFTHAGVIDNGYRGEIKILFHNAGNEFQTFRPGDKVAQMVLIPTVECLTAQVEEFTDITDRNNGGFGSTGN